MKKNLPAFRHYTLSTFCPCMSEIAAPGKPVSARSGNVQSELIVRDFIIHLKMAKLFLSVDSKLKCISIQTKVKTTDKYKEILAATSPTSWCYIIIPGRVTSAWICYFYIKIKWYMQDTGGLHKLMVQQKNSSQLQSESQHESVLSSSGSKTCITFLAMETCWGRMWNIKHLTARF